MARSLFIALFLACATLSAAQTNLDALPKAERDSTLVAIVQKLLRAKFPAYYRENIRPEITERKYAPSPKDSVPAELTHEECMQIIAAQEEKGTVPKRKKASAKSSK